MPTRQNVGVIITNIIYQVYFHEMSINYLIILHNPFIYINTRLFRFFNKYPQNKFLHIQQRQEGIHALCGKYRFLDVTVCNQ